MHICIVAMDYILYGTSNIGTIEEAGRISRNINKSENIEPNSTKNNVFVIQLISGYT